MAQKRTSRTFFCYSRDDSEFALKLAKDLREAGANIWIDQLDIGPGEHWDDAVEKALKSSRAFLIILSPTSVESQNVKDELGFALQEGKQVIPVVYRECNIPFRVQRIQHITLTEDYHGGVQEVLKALGLSEPEVSSGAEEDDIQVPPAVEVPDPPQMIEDHAQPPAKEAGGTTPAPRMSSVQRTLRGALICYFSVFLWTFLVGLAYDRLRLDAALIIALSGLLAGVITRLNARVFRYGLLGVALGLVVFALANGVGRPYWLEQAVFFGLPAGAAVGRIIVRRARRRK
jgi:hypothetical protein